MLQPEDLPPLLHSPSEKLEVEIGCGNGHFMVEYCLKNPTTLFIGVEIKNIRCLKAKGNIDKRGLVNSRLSHGS